MTISKFGEIQGSEGSLQITNRQQQQQQQQQNDSSNNRTCKPRFLSCPLLLSQIKKKRRTTHWNMLDFSYTRF